MQQTDLVKIFGSSGRVSEVVNGKRGISKAQAKALARILQSLAGVVHLKWPTKTTGGREPMVPVRLPF